MNHQDLPQTQLELHLQFPELKQDTAEASKAALKARATLYQIQATNLRKEAEKLNARIAHLDAMVAYFSHIHHVQ
jgi:cbb3-type cytochrome oxidase cytochrome c subunit